MFLRGNVVAKPFSIGSKSERSAVILTTAGGEFVLRRRDGNPFSDPILEQLVGKTIECEGVVHGNTLILDDWSTTTD